MIKHLSIRAQGRVQGVFYRLAAKDQALSLGLSGLARNEPDGGVLIEAEGEETALARFAEWCAHGPEQSTVRKLEIQEGPVTGLKGFLVR